MKRLLLPFLLVVTTGGGHAQDYIINCDPADNLTDTSFHPVAEKKSSPGRNEGFKDNDKRFVLRSLNEKPVWMSWKELKKILAKGENYVDVTGSAVTHKWAKSSRTYPVPAQVRFEQQVKGILDMISMDEVKTFLTYFSTTFQCRSGYEDPEDNSINASNWIYEQVHRLLEKYEGPCPKINHYQHVMYISIKRPMKSVLVRLTGADPTLQNEVVILGAHMDGSGTNACPIPAADDNGSGVSALVETLRILVKKKFVPKRTLEFHFYAYEEVGCFGSSQIAEIYRNDSVNVVGMVNFDMVGYLPQDNPEAKKIALAARDTNAQINSFLEKLIQTYLAIPWTVSDVCERCNSDHSSWTLFQFPSAFPHEVVLSPYYHKPEDTIDTINFDHLKEFTKLAVAYAVEYAEPMQTK